MIKKLGQAGAAPVLVLVTIIGLVGFLAISSTAAFKNGLFANLFPKPPSQAAAPTSNWQNITPPISLNFNNPPNNYGTMQVVFSAAQPTTLYVGTNYQGIWKSTNSGQSWVKANTGGYRDNNGNVIPSGSCGSLDDGRNWTMVADQTDPNIVFTVDGYGCAQGIWKTTDGGVTWKQMFSSNVAQQSTNDISWLDIDPSNHLHLIVGTHSGWAALGGGSGMWETKDGGVTWVLHPMPGGISPTNHSALFITSTTWIVATQDSGVWRTTDSGSSWAQVSNFGKAHGGSQLYKSSTGVLYLGMNSRVIRSTDNGVSWVDSGAPFNQDGYMGIVGDGTNIYTASANTGSSSIGPVHYYYTAETDGTHWAQMNAQTFADGPINMVYDSVNHVVYSSNWDAGVWKLPTNGSSPTPTPTSAPTVAPSATPNPLPGDINGSKKVDILDYNLLITDYGATSGTGLRSDLNNSGKVDILDYNLLITNYGKSIP